MWVMVKGSSNFSVHIKDQHAFSEPQESFQAAQVLWCVTAPRPGCRVQAAALDGL